MKKSIRSLALMSVLVLAVQPMFAYGGAGGDPVPHMDSSLVWMTVAYTVFSVFGF